MILQSDIFLFTAYIIHNDCDSSWKKFHEERVISYFLNLQLFRMISANKIIPILPQGSIPIEVKKDITNENTISLQPQFYENGTCSK